MLSEKPEEGTEVMPSKSAPKPPRNFDSAPGLSDEARQAVNAAFDAMSNWRIETANASERNLEQVIEKTATAARALGWPEQIVDATRAQFQSITKMQTQTMDQIMDAWEEQIKSSNPSSAMLSKLNLPQARDQRLQIEPWNQLPSGACSTLLGKSGHQPAGHHS
jgi:hypothetical protein